VESKNPSKITEKQMRMTAPRSRRVPVALVCLITLTSMYLQSLTFSMPKPTGDGEREDMIIPMGKYSGMTLSELVDEDPKYCRWMMHTAEEEDASEFFLEAAQWLRENAADLLDQESASGVGDDFVVTIGKYSGRLLREIVQEDPDYCLWIWKTSEEEDAGPGVRQAGQWLRANAPELENRLPEEELDYVVGFGKYRGRLLREVVQEDAGYCFWILEKSKEEDCGFSLGDAARWLLKNAPQLQESSMELEFTFGKYKGELVSSVVGSDPDYCCWVVDTAATEDSGVQLRMIASFIKEKFPEVCQDDPADSDPVVGFGKHKGLKFSELMEEHSDYVEWVIAEAAQGDGSSNRNFQKLADFLAKQRDVNGDVNGTAAVMA